MYESPIKVFQGNLEMQFEGEILKAVQRADITVDRDELIRALRYDREQYQKGFDDARKGAVLVVRCKDCKYHGLICCPAVHETMGSGLVDCAVDNGYCWVGKPKEETT